MYHVLHIYKLHNKVKTSAHVFSRNPKLRQMPLQQKWVNFFFGDGMGAFHKFLSYNIWQYQHILFGLGRHMKKVYNFLEWGLCFEESYLIIFGSH